MTQPLFRHDTITKETVVVWFRNLVVLLRLFCVVLFLALLVFLRSIVILVVHIVFATSILILVGCCFISLCFGIP